MLVRKLWLICLKFTGSLAYKYSRMFESLFRVRLTRIQIFTSPFFTRIWRHDWLRHTSRLRGVHNAYIRYHWCILSVQYGGGGPTVAVATVLERSTEARMFRFHQRFTLGWFWTCNTFKDGRKFRSSTVLLQLAPRWRRSWWIIAAL